MIKRNNTLATFGIIISFLVLTLFIASVIFQNELQSTITEEAEGYGYLFVVIISALLEFVPQFIAPTILMLNAAVLNMSLATVTGYIIIGSAIGGIAGFMVGRKLGRGFADHTFGKKRVKKVASSLNSYGKWFVMFAALTPLPYVPIIFGSLGMSKKNITLFGIIPRAISYIIFWIILELGIDFLF